MRIRPLAIATSLLTVMASVTWGCSEFAVAPDPPPDYGTVFDQLWSDADLHYPFFRAKGINWDSLRTLYRPRAVNAANDRAFAATLGDILGELHDPHVSITPFGAGSTVRYLSLSDTTPAYFNAQMLGDRYLGLSASTVSSRYRSATVAPGVGYLGIASFKGTFSSAELDEALMPFVTAKALIVDVRNNNGGKYAMAVDVAGRFVPSRERFGYLRFRNGASHDALTDFIPEVVQPLGRVRFRGTVFLLTNRRTVSSAEVFVQAMRVNPQVLVVGDTTFGASGGPTARELPNGWLYELSEWIDYTLDRKCFEGVGLAPDVMVPHRFSEAVRKVDPVFERALALAKEVPARTSMSAHANRRDAIDVRDNIDARRVIRSRSR